LLVASSLVAGLAFVTREESIIFSLLLLGSFLIISKARLTDWLLVGVIGLLCFTPQLYAKWRVLGSVTASGRDNSYTNVKDEYLQPSLLYRNGWEVLVDSRRYADSPLHPAIQKQCTRPGSCPPEPAREALFYEAPWLWLSPLGLIIVFSSKKYKRGIKIFAGVSLILMLFYLSGANMSAQKLKFHTLRYISPAFIMLNLGVVIVAKESVSYVVKYTSPKNDKNTTTKRTKIKKGRL